MFNLRLDESYNRKPLTAVRGTGLRDTLEDIFSKLELKSRPLEAKELENVERKVRFVVDYALSYIFEPAKEIWNPELYSGGHFEDVAICSILLGQASGMGRNDLAALSLAAIFHDIGKYMNLEMYRKHGKFTPEECEIKKKHPWDSYILVADSLKILPERTAISVIDGIIYHHTDFNGFGYPGYKNPPEESRVIRIADSLEAITTNNRPYKKMKNCEEAIQDLIMNSGIKYDPRLVQILTKGYDATNGTNYSVNLHEILNRGTN